MNTKQITVMWALIDALKKAIDNESLETAEAIREAMSDLMAELPIK